MDYKTCLREESHYGGTSLSEGMEHSRGVLEVRWKGFQGWGQHQILLHHRLGETQAPK